MPCLQVLPCELQNRTARILTFGYDACADDLSILGWKKLHTQRKKIQTSNMIYKCKDVTRVYSREEGCVMHSLNGLNWQSQQHMKQVARLRLLHKAVHNKGAITIPPHTNACSTQVQLRNSKFSSAKIYPCPNFM